MTTTQTTLPTIPKWPDADPSTFPQYLKALRRYSVEKKCSHVLFQDTTGITPPQGQGVDAVRSRAQANALMYEAMMAAVDDTELTAIVDDEDALDYKAVDLFAAFKAYAAGPIAILAGPDLLHKGYTWPWPHEAGTLGDQVTAAITSLKALLAASKALNDAEYQLTEGALCYRFRAEMPIALQMNEARYRSYNKFTTLLAEASRDARTIDAHPERFAVLAYGQHGKGTPSTTRRMDEHAGPLVPGDKYCDRHGWNASHGTEQCFQKQGDRSKDTCYICGEHGHWMAECTRLNASDQGKLNDIVNRAKKAPEDLLYRKQPDGTFVAV